MSFERQHAGHGDDHHAIVDAELVAPGRHAATEALVGGHGPIASGLLHRKAERDDNGVAAGAEAAVTTAAGSTGFGLPTEVRRSFESSLGADLGGVRVHTGGASADAAHAVGARAYAVGQDIHFGEGQFDPGSTTGLHLLAHEVAHTVQQQGGASTRQHKLAVSSVGDRAEVEADAAADAMIARQPFAIGSGGGSVARSTVFRDPNFTPGPVPDPGPKQSVPASEADKESAREKILAAQVEADAAIDRVSHWTRDQWSQFIGATVESPAVVWQPTLLRKGLGALAGKGIGVAVGAASSAAKALPEVGWLVSKGIDLLGGALKDAAKEKIEGGKALSPAAASSAGRAAAITQLRAKLNEIDAKATEVKTQLAVGYKRQLPLVAARDMDKADVDAVSRWADADIAASRALAPSGDALYRTMLLTWVGEHAADGNGSGKPGTNQTDFKNAVKTLFGADQIPAYWALQLRQDFLQLGLSTERADALLAGGAATAATSGEMYFDTAADLDALAKAFTPENSGPFLHLAQGGGFRLRVQYTTAGMASDLYGPGFVYLQGANYHLMTEGMVGGDKPYVRSSTHAGGTARY